MRSCGGHPHRPALALTRCRSLRAAARARRRCAAAVSRISPATACMSAPVTRSNPRRRIEQLAPVAVEHFVFAEQLRLAVDGGELLPEARRPPCSSRARELRLGDAVRATRASSASTPRCTSSGSAPSGSVSTATAAPGSKPSCQWPPTSMASCLLLHQRRCSREASPSTRIESSRFTAGARGSAAAGAL